MRNLALLPQPENVLPFPVKSNEWFTPACYIEAAREVMDGIDLDPASCELANRTVKAARYFTEKQDGLKQEWGGRMWLNPPYSSPHSPAGMRGGKQQGPTGLFITKLLDAFERGKVTQAVLCVNADMCRSWFQPLWAYPICFSSRPVQFVRPNQQSEHHFFSTAFAYLGPHEQKFIDIFSAFGVVARRVSPAPVARPFTLPLWEGV